MIASLAASGGAHTPKKHYIFKEMIIIEKKLFEICRREEDKENRRKAKIEKKPLFLEKMRLATLSSQIISLVLFGKIIC